MTDVRLVGAVATGSPFMIIALQHPSLTVEQAIERMLAVREGDTSVTDVRLVGTGNQNQRARRALESPDMTDVRLVGANAGHDQGYQVASFARADDARAPALLISYAYWKSFAKFRHLYHFRDYSLDSGAFSVEHSGGKVDLQQYIEFCLERMATDAQCTEVFALDVIFDWRATARNVERMWAAGVPAIPTYHRGEPEAVLKAYVRDYPKVALGGFSHLRGDAKLAWAKECFARAWPARLHGLGVMGERVLMACPFHSVDASNWEAGPARFGSWKTLGTVKGLRGGKTNFRMEVEWYLALERRLKQRWTRELAMVERECPPWPLRTPAQCSSVAASTLSLSGLSGAPTVSPSSSTSDTTTR